MPRALYQIQTEAENTAYAYISASSLEEDEEDLEDLLIIPEFIASDQYLLSRNTSLGQHIP